MKLLRNTAFLGSFLFFALTARGSATRIIDADALISSTHATTVTMPARTGTAIVSVGVVQETPSGTVNGSNVTFTLANTPGSVSTVTLTVDGLRLTQGSGKDYTISGATITMGTAPAVGQVLWAVYSKD